MKRIVSMLVAFIMLMSVFSMLTVNVAAEFPSIDDMNGYENLCLSYTWNPGRADNGRFDVETFMPFVAYYDTDGVMKDFYFDSFLFLPCVKEGASGARIHYDKTNPTKAIDWTSYVQDTFSVGKNVDALDVAMGRAKEQLDKPDAKAGVIFTILYPGVESGKNFGSLGGKELDFKKLDDRKYAIKWMIDEQLSIYNERGYENLDLIGFYWLEEYLRTDDDNLAQERELFRYASDYLHSLGLKFIWIPYFHTSGYQEWKRLGFDVACMQPNMYWQQQADPERVNVCANDCYSLGMGVEMEIDGRALTSAEYYNRYLDYLQGCLNKGAMDSIKMYYQDGMPGVYYNSYKSTNARARSIYDLTYKYAKGTLTQKDIKECRSDELKLSENVDWVSVGKTYTASKAFFDGNGAEYQLIDGKELTDGYLGSTELGTDWHAFHVTLMEPDGLFHINIDLDKVYEGLTDFIVQFSHVQKYGIDDPSDTVKVYVSEDGNNYTLVAEPKLEFENMLSFARVKTDPVNARYVKFTFGIGGANFVFCGEALAGIEKEIVEVPDTSDDTQESADDEIAGDDTTSADIVNSDESVVSDDQNIATDSDTKNNWIIWVSIIAGAVVGAAVVAFIAKKKKK